MLNKDAIINLLKVNNIPYATKGKNIGKKAIVGINCPFCGDDDGKHLGLMEKGYYTCWKNNNHRGTLVNLFSKLLNISILEANNLINKTNYIIDDFNPEKLFVNNKKEQVIFGHKKTISFLEEFKEIKNTFPTKIFYNYLVYRGFKNVELLVTKYNLKCSLIGEWANRIIIPIYENNKLVTWTGRSILQNKNILRYKDLSPTESVKQVKFCLWEYDNLKYGGRILYITEGIFDAMKIDYYTDNNIKATCIFTTSIRDEQIRLLSTINKKFTRINILLDKGAESQALNLYEKLSFLKNVNLTFLPDGIDDPGSMTEKQIKEIIC